MSAATERIPIGMWETNDEDETFALGERIGAALTGGEIILLDGPLGAGKTIFVKGLAAALSVDANDVTSPSFTLVNRHDTAQLTFYHLDLYRLPAGASAAHAVDLDELLTDDRAVIVIEWAERLGQYPLPPPAWHVLLTGDGAEPRRIQITRL